MLLVCLCCLIAVSAAWGQTANSASKPGILGYLDPVTGAFRPVPAVTEENLAEAPAATLFTGTITLTITVTLKTTALTNITCNADSVVEDNLTTLTPRFITETNTVAATGSGATRTCKLSIPYSWSLLTSASDSISTSYSVSGSVGTTGLPQRISSLRPLDTRKVPASGTTTALTAAVTL
jgi:hypothetical protein